MIDGVVASETSNNACIGGAMVPLLTLGIPGDGTTAVLLGALMVHGISAGPLIFQKNGTVVYAIYAAMILASIFMFLSEYIGIRGFINILKIPKSYLLHVVMVLCMVGAFGSSNRVFDVQCAMAFGLMGYVMKKCDLPFPPVVLGFILGPIFESNLRRVAQYQTVDPTTFLSHPIAIVFVVITVVTLVMNIISIRKKGSALKKEK